MLSRLVRSTRPSVRNQRAAMQFVANFHAAPPARENDAAVAAPEPTLMDTLKEPMIAGPMMGLVSLGAIGNHMYHFDEETQLLGLFTLFVGTVFTMSGETIGKAIDEETNQILVDMNEQEDAVIEQIELAIAKMEGFCEAHEDMKQIIDYKKTLIDKVLDFKSADLKYKTHNHFVTLLNNAVAQEDNQRMKLKAALVERATAAVSKELAAPKVVQASVDEALKVIAGKEGKDLVGASFETFFNAESSRMQKDAAKSIVDTPTDMAALFNEMRTLTTGDAILDNDKAMKSLVDNYKTVPQTTGDVAELLAGPTADLKLASAIARSDFESAVKKLIASNGGKVE